MTRTLADFADFQTSKHCNAAPVYRIEDEDTSIYAAFLYAEHQLYKIVGVGPYLTEAHDVADVIAHQFSSCDPEDFSTWIEQQFPEDVNIMSHQQIAQMFE